MHKGLNPWLVNCHHSRNILIAPSLWSTSFNLMLIELESLKRGKLLQARWTRLHHTKSLSSNRSRVLLLSKIQWRCKIMHLTQAKSAHHQIKRRSPDQACQSRLQKAKKRSLMPSTVQEIQSSKIIWTPKLPSRWEVAFIWIRIRSRTIGTRIPCRVLTVMRSGPTHLTKETMKLAWFKLGSRVSHRALWAVQTTLAHPAYMWLILHKYLRLLKLHWRLQESILCTNHQTVRLVVS